MSDLLLNACAENYTEKNVDKMIKDIKIRFEFLSKKGRRELLKDYIMFAYMTGHNLNEMREQQENPCQNVLQE